MGDQQGNMQVQYNVGQDTTSLLSMVLGLVTGRAATIQVENNCDYALFYDTTTTFYHGNWGGQWPLQNDCIRPGSAAIFAAQSTGFMTGVEAWINFKAYYGDDPSGNAQMFMFSIYVDNPYLGSNVASAALSGGYASQYAARYHAGGGNTANFIYQLYNWQNPGSGGQTAIGGPQIADLTSPPP